MVLDILPFPHPHDAESISETIYQVISEWDYLGKVLAITVDNGPNIIKAAKLLSGFKHSKKSSFKLPTNHIIPFHMRCETHTLQLIISGRYRISQKCNSIF